MTKALVTGGAGFFGGVLLDRLLADGVDCVSVDVQPPSREHDLLTSVRTDLTDAGAVQRVFAEHRPEVVYHVAAMLAHAVKDENHLWASNVDGTRNVARAAVETGVTKLVFTSSNCLWGENLHRPVTEEDQPRPVEIYGRSKWEGEKILEDFSGRLDSVVIRCPTIIDAGRLGLLAILFQFIHEGRKVPVVGGGDNHYQFIFAPDLADACVRAAEAGKGVYGIGADEVGTMRGVFEEVIQRAGTGSRVVAFPKGPTLAAMRLADLLHLSPLGPYHYRMIAEDFVFDTSKIKSELGWRPTETNGGMLARAYEYYASNLEEIASATDVSAHRQPAEMGVIRLLKWFL